MSKSVAYLIDEEFVPGKTYEIFTCAVFENLRHFAGPAPVYAYGTELKCRRYRLNFEFLVPTEALYLNLVFLDSELANPPDVFEYEQDDIARACSSRISHRSIFDNDFFWAILPPTPRQRYEIAWWMPHPKELLHRVLLADRKRPPEALDLMSAFAGQASLVLPSTVAEAYKEIEQLFSLAEKEIIIIDPFLDRSAERFLGHVKPHCEVHLVARCKQKRALEAVATFARSRQLVPRITMKEEMHDRFLIVDSYRLFHLGTSINGLDRKASMLHEFTVNLPQTHQLIGALRAFAGS